MFKRYTSLEDTNTDSIFLFGARQTGRTTLINGSPDNYGGKNSVPLTQAVGLRLL